MKWDDDPTTWKQVCHLIPEEMQIVLGARGSAQRLERALLLVWMRVEHVQVTDVTTLPPALIAAVAQQLSVSPTILHDYRSHQQTRTDATHAIRTYLGMRPYTAEDRDHLDAMVAAKVAHTGHTTVLIQAAEEWLNERSIVHPSGETAIERLVYAARTRAEDAAFARILAQLTADQQAHVETLCAMTGGDSLLAMCVKPPRNASAPAIVAECQRLHQMRQLLVDDITWGDITTNRLRQWAAVVRRLSAQALRRYPPAKRCTLLLAFLVIRCEEVTNIIVEMFDVLVGKLFSTGEEAVASTKAKRAQAVQQSAKYLRKVYEVMIDAQIPDEQVRAKIFQRIPPAQWEEQISLYDAFERGEVDILFDLLQRRFGYMRSFAPTVLQTLQFASPRADHPLLDGIQILATLEGKTGRAAQLPSTTPMDFVPSKWQQIVQSKDGAVQRQAWEMTAMHEVRKAVRSGDLTITGSQRYASWDTDLYSREAWATRRERWYQEMGLPMDGSVYVQQLREELDALTRQVSAGIPHLNTSVRIMGGKLHVEALDPISLPPEVDRTRDALFARLPHPGLPDLLMEVDTWVPITDAFFHLTARRAPSSHTIEESRPALLAALIAEGTNLGLTTMARASGIKESHLQRMADWYLREETIREAVTLLLQYQHSLPLAAKFGDGTTSSSDGIRFGVTSSTLHGRHQPRYFGVKRGVTLINHVSDQHSQFWIDVVNCQLRESTYVLDGLVDQDTFPIKEHYTDTNGYTDLLFGCFEMLGFRFAPRLKDLPDQVLYRMNKAAEYGVLDEVLGRTIRESLIITHWDDLNRLAASFKDGIATPSVVIGKLQGMQQLNPLQQAMQELGRVAKTRHILHFIHDEAFRRRVLIGLNRGERINALARVLFFGQQGRFTHREYEAQVHRATALSLLINAILVWNTRYLDAAATAHGPIADTIWTHISPVSWEHIQLVGTYDFAEPHFQGALRPLRSLTDVAS